MSGVGMSQDSASFLLRELIQSGGFPYSPPLTSPALLVLLLTSPRTPNCVTRAAHLTTRFPVTRFSFLRSTIHL